MAGNIASGMEYIESKRYVHRDLAARNVLLDENLVCKVADFGLTGFIEDPEYTTKKGTRFAIRWAAPEVIEFKKFTIKSDVWSFGILLTELFNKGKNPYPELSNSQAAAAIREGKRMHCPDGCPQDFYDEIMLQCWDKNPEKRPCFKYLKDVIPSFNDYETPEDYPNNAYASTYSLSYV